MCEFTEVVELHARFFDARHDSIVRVQKGSLIIFEYILCFRYDNIIVAPKRHTVPQYTVFDAQRVLPLPAMEQCIFKTDFKELHLFIIVE